MQHLPASRRQVPRAGTVHITPTLFGDDGRWGGGERFGLELARAQAALRPTALVTFGKPRSFSLGALQVHVLAPRTHLYGHFLNPLSEQLVPHVRRADVVHVHQVETALSDFALACCKVLGRRAFVTDLGGGAGSFHTRFDRRPVVEAHLALSEFAAGFHPYWQDRTTVIGAGVDLEMFRVDGAVHRQRLAVYVGRLMPYKGADVLIKALPQGLPLQLFGRAYDAHYFRHLQDLAVGKDVTFVTDATDAEVVAAYQRARVVVLPSIPVTTAGEPVPKMELFGLVLAEAMACGTPVICSDAGGMREVVLPGRTGFVVPPGDVAALAVALTRVTGDDAAWQTMSAAAAAHARTLSWPAVAERCFAAYDAEHVPVRRSPTAREVLMLLRPPQRLARRLHQVARAGAAPKR